MRIVYRAQYKRTTWKNGQGLTEEVAVFPPDGDVDGFDWRLSIAHVGADGPFSVFPGIDRTIALLDGAGLALDLPDARTVELKPDGEPFSFSGDWQIFSRNLGGPTIDLNIMSRRGRSTHEMLRLTLSPGNAFTAAHFTWVLFNTAADIAVDGQRLAIDRFDALSLEVGENFANLTATNAQIMVITIK